MPYRFPLCKIKKSNPKRKEIRIIDFNYATPSAYFITICTAERKPILWDIVGADIIRPENLPLSKIGAVVEQGIGQISDHYQNVSIDKYCIMPDHIHMILSIHAEENGRILSAPTVSAVVGSMKRWVSKQVGRSLWQKSFYDHIIRNSQDYNEIWTYIENNPKKF